MKTFKCSYIILILDTLKNYLLNPHIYYVEILTVRNNKCAVLRKKKFKYIVVFDIYFIFKKKIYNT